MEFPNLKNSPDELYQNEAESILVKSSTTYDEDVYVQTIIFVEVQIKNLSFEVNNSKLLI